jgi:hypothetical protein
MRFQDEGLHTLKGLPGERHLFALVDLPVE